RVALENEALACVFRYFGCNRVRFLDGTGEFARLLTLPVDLDNGIVVNDKFLALVMIQPRHYAYCNSSTSFICYGVTWHINVTDSGHVVRHGFLLRVVKSMSVAPQASSFFAPATFSFRTRSGLTGTVN